MPNKKIRKIKSSKYIDVASDDTDSTDSEDEKTIIRLRTANIDKKGSGEINDLNNSDNSDNSDNSMDVEESASSEEFVEKILVPKKKIVKNSNEIFKELIKHQLPDVPSRWKLNINDMKRICKYIDTSIFDKNHCCIWNGYITNMNNSNKGTYVNFYFRNKKVALHRLLYSNFMAPLDSSEYLKFNCENKGICCNVYHYEKYKYSKNYNMAKKEPRKKESRKEINDVSIVGSDEKDKLIVDFD